MCRIEFRRKVFYCGRYAETFDQRHLYATVFNFDARPKRRAEFSPEETRPRIRDLRLRCAFVLARAS